MTKSITLIFIFLSFVSFAQDDFKKDNETTLFNKWSIELNAGLNKPLRPFSDGYYQDFNGIKHFDLGSRYMFNTLFGLKLDVAYDEVKNNTNSSSIPFNCKVYRVGLQSVYNLSTLFNFNSFSNRLGLLAHAGVQGSFNNYGSINNKNNIIVIGPEPPPSEQSETNKTTKLNTGFIIGITPQFRISNKISLTSDVSVINNINQSLSWDGNSSAINNNFSGVIYNVSFGLSFYLGKNEKHADWFITKTLTKDEESRKRLDDIEALMNDVDKDGVPDYLDVQNNTPNGVTVDAKGRFIDSNKNNVPDELENTKTATVTNVVEDVDVLKELVEKGLTNVYFDVNKDLPNAGSTNNLFIIIKYLNQYPKSKITLMGYADESGNLNDNLNLSTRRAQNVKQLLINYGIDSSRIQINGLGVDKPYINSSSSAKDLSRRVSLKIE